MLLFSSFNPYKLYGKPQFNNDIDSLQYLVLKCSTDTCKFAILSNYFWQLSNADEDIKLIKPIGEWAFEVIKNSQNLKALSDGYDIKGSLYEKEEKPDSAFYCFNTALKLSQKTGYKSRMAWSYFHLGLLNDALGHHEEAINQMRLSIRTFEEINEIYNAYNGIAYVIVMFMRSCQYDSADAYISKRLDLDRRMNNKTAEIFTYNNYSWYYKKIGQSKKSIDYMNCALQLAENNKDVLLTDVYVIIGEFFLGQKKNRQLALEYCKKGFKADSSSTYVCQLFAKYYLEETKDSLALKYALQGIQKSTDEQDLYEANQTLALVYQHLGKTQLALDALMKCYEHARSFYPEFEFYEILLQIGDLNLKHGNYSEALKYYHETLGIAGQYHAKRAFVLANLKIGKCYVEQKQEDKSESFYLSALKAAQEIKDVYLLKSTADALKDFYFKRNNLLIAYRYSILSQTMSDSIAQLDNEASLAELEMNLELSEIKKDNETRQTFSMNEIKRQKTFRNAFILISGLLIVLGLVFFYSYRRKRKDNKLLIDQKKQIEEKNREIQAQVEEITSQKDEIERISSELHLADETKFRFFTNLSHEFRTPLTLILNPARNLLDTMPLNGDCKKQMEYIFNNAQKLFDLTNQIMDLQKLDAGKLQLNLRKDDIIEYCVGIVSSFESLCDAKKVTIQLKANCSNAYASFDKDKIGKILINLLSNAIKFCFENTVIEIKISAINNQFQLQITDQGIGIPANEVNEVFKRYMQASTQNYSGGTGIGLAYVKELVRFMKGNVTLESVEKKGTTISVEIPVTEMEVKNENILLLDISFKNENENLKSFDITEFSEETANKPIIQIVEDNDDLRDFICAIFRNDFQILEAKNGQEGLDYALRFLPDIIVSDVMMPLMNGFEMCLKLKQNEQTSHIPILLLTAKDSLDSQLAGYQSGVDDYIIKPFDSALLKLKVENIITTRDAARKKFNFPLDTLKFPDIDKQFLQKCTDFIRSNIDIPTLTVEKLADHMAFSQRNLFRKIKALTNQTPSDFIKIYRLQYAATLIKNSQLRIYEVAGAIGFESPERFSQAFKKYFGVLPSEY